MRRAEGEERPAGGAEEELKRPPFLGHGIGLRREHYASVLAGEAACDWFEAISENFMVVGGRARKILLAVRERYPMTLHGVSLGIGGTDPVDEGYLDALKALAADVEPAWVSDHLCWTGVGGRTAHDLLPLPYTEESLANVLSRVAHVQERLGRPLVLENVSSYVGFAVSTMPESEFIAEVARRTGCGLLLDVNNVWVSSVNHGFDASAYLAAIPRESVWQFHLAGPSEAGPLLLDTHDHPVRTEVWELYREAVERFGEVSSLVEWDDRIPEIGVVLAERDKAAAIAMEVRAGGGGAKAGPTAGRGPELAAGSERAMSKRGTAPELSDRADSSRDRGRADGRLDRLPAHDPEGPAPRLRAAQQLFLDLVAAPEGVAKELDAREARGERARAALDGLLAGDERRTTEERLDVYANMYFFRLRDALAEDFARTAAALGEARWHNLVTDFLLAHPPTRWSLRWAGEALPEFLRTHPYGAERPWLADVATLERTRNEAFLAVDAAPLRAEALLGVHPEVWPALSFGAVPGTAVVESRWDLDAFWRGETGSPVEAPGGQRLLVWRDAADDVRHEALDAADAKAASRLLAGAPFAEVCEGYAPGESDEAGFEDAGRKGADLLSRLVARGVVTLAT